MSREFHVPCPRGVEAALEGELVALGVAAPRMSAGGAVFRAEADFIPRANLWLRSAIRVQELLARGPVRGPDALYDLAAKIPWETMIREGDTLSVRCALDQTRIKDSRYPALLVKDAVVDRLRDRCGWRPDVDRKRPTLPLRLLLRRDMAFLYRDTSGATLHKRGYRPIQVKSPLNEALAAGLLLLGGYDGEGSLVDPMCGSGTLVIEAAMIAGRRAPGLKRDFAFLHWPDADLEGWEALKAEARAGERPVADRLLGFDHHPGAIAIAERSAAMAGVADEVAFERRAVDAEPLEDAPRWVVVNPPFGERLGEGDELEQAWVALGRFLKESCPEARALVLCGNPELTRHLRLKASRRFPVRNGPLDCRLLAYDILPPR